MSDNVRIAWAVCVAALSGIALIAISILVGNDLYYQAVRELQAECLKHEGYSYLAGKDWCLADGMTIKQGFDW